MTGTRDEFEHHFRLTIRQRRRNRNGEYCYVDVQAKWEGWQAREQLAAPVAPSNTGGNPHLPPEKGRESMFPESVKAFFGDLANKQEPLPEDMQKVLLDNAWDLYAASKITHACTVCYGSGRDVAGKPCPFNCGK